MLKKNLFNLILSIIVVNVLVGCASSKKKKDAAQVAPVPQQLQQQVVPNTPTLPYGTANNACPPGYTQSTTVAYPAGTTMGTGYQPASPNGYTTNGIPAGCVPITVGSQYPGVQTYQGKLPGQSIQPYQGKLPY